MDFLPTFMLCNVEDIINKSFLREIIVGEMDQFQKYKSMFLRYLEASEPKFDSCKVVYHEILGRLSY